MPEGHSSSSGSHPQPAQRPSWPPCCATTTSPAVWRHVCCLRWLYYANHTCPTHDEPWLGEHHNHHQQLEEAGPGVRR